MGCMLYTQEQIYKAQERGYEYGYKEGCRKALKGTKDTENVFWEKEYDDLFMLLQKQFVKTVAEQERNDELENELWITKERNKRKVVK